MKALEAFNAGSLDEAIDLAKNEVKSNPTDVAKRNVFCEMLCWAGDLKRADKQLETLMMQDPSSAMGMALFRQLIRGETARQECFNEGRAPELLHEADDLTRLHLEVMLSIREGNNARAVELVEEIDEKRPKVSGTCDGEAFHDLRDLDDTCCSFAEVITSTGKYYWVPFDRIELITLQPVERPRDLMWRRAHMIVHGGPDGEVYLPVNYARSLGSEDKQLRLGRATVWTGGEDAPALGQGRRLWLVGDHDKSLLEMSELILVKEVEDGSPATAQTDAAESSGE